jgi:hypothetical protein
MLPNVPEGVPHNVLSGNVLLDELKADFRKFLFLTWQHLGLPKPTEVQYDIAYWMQHGPRRKMIMAFRGVGKTWIYGSFVAWRLLCNPDWKIMVVSATKPYADDFSKFVKQLIAGMPVLQHLKPGKEQRDANDKFDVGPAKLSKDPSVKSVGIFGQLAGSRANEILSDDIETVANSATEGAREKLAEAVKEFDAVLKPGGTVTYLGTPQTFMSMYKKLPERGYTIRVWTARVPSNVEDYNGTLAPFIVRLLQNGSPAGTVVDPQRFSDEDLQERERSYGAAGFALQFMLNTADSDAYRFPLKLQDMPVMSLDPRMAPTKVVWGRDPDKVVENVQNFGLPGDRWYRPMFLGEQMAEYSGSVMSIDPSGRGNDETSYAVVKHLMGNLFVPAAGGLQGGYDDDTLGNLAEIAKSHNVNMIIVEENFGGGMFAKLLQPHLTRVGHPCTIEEVRHNKQKELRIIDTLEPVIMQHRLVVDEGLIMRDYNSAPNPVYSLFYQLTRITRDRGALKHDDRLDALAIAVAYWVEQMAQDNDKANQRHYEQLLDMELKSFMRDAFGGGGRRRNRFA